VLWTLEECTGNAQVRIQADLDKITDWTESWLVSLNESKNTYTIVSRFNKKHNVKLALKDMKIKK
jgi:predicted HAD superfamily phosphohydrolase YqeG